ncbi:MAG: hypothetical protein BWX70_03011 [Verrucomicrobia bacterium ADurb.Bin070]|nr:MAG: hypothetical protein BWX70_03011 [Verrucomicrobia bacterium ADurb.Bin070]
MLRLEVAELLAGDHVGHRAAGIRSRQQNRLAGIENRGGLSHKVNTAEHNDIRLDVGRLAREFQRIAREVGDVLHLTKLIVVGQDDGVPFSLQQLNLVMQSHGHSQITYHCRCGRMIAYGRRERKTKTGFDISRTNEK